MKTIQTEYQPGFELASSRVEYNIPDSEEVMFILHQYWRGVTPCRFLHRVTIEIIPIPPSNIGRGVLGLHNDGHWALGGHDVQPLGLGVPKVYWLQYCHEFTPATSGQIWPKGPSTNHKTNNPDRHDTNGVPSWMRTRVLSVFCQFCQAVRCQFRKNVFSASLMIGNKSNT